MFFHQWHNSVGGDVYNAFLYRGLAWQTHIHKAFELALVLDGKITAEIGGEAYVVNTGEAALVTPFMTHAYRSEPDSVTFVMVFSGNYVEDFSRAVAGKTPVCPIFTPSPETLGFLERFVVFPGKSDDERRLPSPDEFSILITPPEPLRLKASLYAACADFLASTTLASGAKSDSLVRDILNYVEKNYAEDITLVGMANALGYDYRYLSRLFGKSFSMNFKALVNQYRVDRAASLIRSTALSLSEIALSCGFQSIRSFNRAFKEITGATPGSLRKREPV